MTTTYRELQDAARTKALARKPRHKFARQENLNNSKYTFVVTISTPKGYKLEEFTIGAGDTSLDDPHGVAHEQIADQVRRLIETAIAINS